VRLQQNAPFLVADDVGEELVVLADRPQSLSDTVLIAPDDVYYGERQQALRCFLKRGVEDLVHLVTQHHCRHRGGGDPEDGQQDAEGQPQAGL
jgi:hypothetical protein